MDDSQSTDGQTALGNAEEIRMRFLEHAEEGKRIHFTKRQEVPPMQLGCYSKEDCDLRFTYKKGSETRGIWLELTRDEAKELLEFLERFLGDTWE